MSLLMVGVGVGGCVASLTEMRTSVLTVNEQDMSTLQRLSDGPDARLLLRVEVLRRVPSPLTFGLGVFCSQASDVYLFTQQEVRWWTSSLRELVSEDSRGL